MCERKFEIDKEIAKFEVGIVHTHIVYKMSLKLRRQSFRDIYGFPQIVTRTTKNSKNNNTSSRHILLTTINHIDIKSGRKIPG